jgi:hypothetical protein
MHLAYRPGAARKGDGVVVSHANFSRDRSEIDAIARQVSDRGGFRPARFSQRPRAGSTMPRTRVLIVYGAQGDSSDDLARRLALALSREGVPAEACEADEVPDLEEYDGVALEDAREGAGWTLFARNFARRHASELRNPPAWFLPSTRGPGGAERRDQTRWAHAIARWLGEPPAASRRIAWPLPN